MKRILSLTLSMLLLLISALAVGAEDTTETDFEASVNIQVYTINLTAKITTNEGASLKVYPLSYDEATETYTIVDEENPVHLWQEQEFTVEGAKYVYTFDPFNFTPNMATGKYRAVINEIYSYDFDFVNKNDKVEFYNNLASASAGSIEEVLQAGLDSGVVDFDLGGYFDYPEDVKSNINDSIAELDLPSLGENPSDELIKEYEDMLKPEFARLLSVAEFVTGTEETFDESVKANAEALGLDLEFYSDEDLELDPGAVYKRYSEIAIPSFAAEDIQTAFDMAVLLAMIDEADYGAVTDALNYYDGKCITLDRSHSRNFTEAQENEVSQLIKKEASSLKTAEDIEDAYLDYSDMVANPDDDDDDDNSYSGGGGGNGGGGYRRPSATGSTSSDSNNNDETNDNNDVTYETNFSDLGEASWAESSIRYLAGKGVLKGKDDGNFHPNDTVTREEFVKIIVEAFDIYDGTATVQFDDVASDRWSYGYIASAYRAGIVTGTSETTFGPQENMTRQDMAVIMYRVANLIGFSASDSGVQFADDAQIAEYAKEAVGALYSAGIINGTGNDCYSPLDTVTRAQAAKIAYELLNAIGGAN